jgi:hypothetical protein
MSEIWTSWAPASPEPESAMDRLEAVEQGPISFDLTERAAFFKTTSTTEHCVTIYQAGTSGVDVAAALNVVQDNPQTSAMYLSGTELDRGTLKVTHRGNAAGADSGAAAISIDLQTSGSAAQGVFITSTAGTPSTGNSITVRTNSRDDFVVKSTGRIGMGLGIASTPAGRLEVGQADDTTVGIAMTANSGSALQMVLLKDSGGNARFEVNAAGNTVMRATAFFTTSIQVGSASADLGGGAGVISIKNRSTAPTTNPTGGVILYAESDVLKYRDPSGAVRTIATV